MQLLLLLLMLFVNKRAMAEEYHILELNTVNLEAYKIINNRSDYWPYKDPAAAEVGQEHWTTGAALNWDIDLFKYGNWDVYWDNKIHMASTNIEVRQVGWQWEAGLHAGEKIDLFWQHHSQHLLDASSPEQYPLENYAGIRINFYKRK